MLFANKNGSTYFLGMPSQEASMKCAVCEQERAHIFSGYALARGFHTCDKFLAAKLYNTDKNWNFDKKKKRKSLPSPFKHCTKNVTKIDKISLLYCIFYWTIKPIFSYISNDNKLQAIFADLRMSLRRFLSAVECFLMLKYHSDSAFEWAMVNAANATLQKLWYTSIPYISFCFGHSLPKCFQWTCLG